MVAPSNPDIAVLQRVRDCNPTSQLPGNWQDSSSAFEWMGVTWNDNGHVKEL
jgi:hypothetical protein